MYVYLAQGQIQIQFWNNENTLHINCKSVSLHKFTFHSNVFCRSNNVKRIPINKHYRHIYICCKHLIYIEANSNRNSYHGCSMLWQSRSKHSPSRISSFFFKPAHQDLWICIPLIFMEEQKKMKLIALYLLVALQIKEHQNHQLIATNNLKY